MEKRCSFMDMAYSHRKTLRCEKFLNEMKEVIPWNKLVNLIKPHYTHSETGRKRKHLTLMLKIYFMQHWYNLSDPEMEDAIYDRSSFQKFLGIDMMAETAPDETTILNFRHLLEKHNLPERMFTKVARILEKEGLILHKGTIVDATIINAPSSTKNQSGKRDEEMSSTKKGNNWYFGMKAHIGTDKDTGVAHTVKFTTAKVHDSQMFDELIRKKDKELYGDKGYFNPLKAEEYKKKGKAWRILYKAVRGKKLTVREEAINKKRSSVRAKVERVFLVVKHLWGCRKTKYKGLHKNSMNLYTYFALANIYLVRKKLLA